MQMQHGSNIAGRRCLLFGKRNRAEAGGAGRAALRFVTLQKISSTRFGRYRRTFIVRLDAYVRLWPERRRVETLPEHLCATRSHSEWVTLRTVSHSGTEAALDFYHLSPFALARFVQTRNLKG